MFAQMVLQCGFEQLQHFVIVAWFACATLVYECVELREVSAHFVGGRGHRIAGRGGRRRRNRSRSRLGGGGLKIV